MKSFATFLVISILTGAFLFLNRYYVSQWSPGQNHLPELEAFSGSSSGTSPNLPDTLWVHRVNSIERYREVTSLFGGIEIDVQFDPETNELTVGHEPEESTLSLSDLIASSNNPESKHYWLDIKQLNISNAAAILQQTELLAAQFSLKDKLIIESPHAAALTPFTRAGYYTSYYLPPFHVFKASNNEISQYVQEVSRQLSEAEVCAISGNHMQLLFMQKYFPGYNYLIWNLDPFSWRRNIMNRLYKTDPRVQIILIPYMTPHWK